MIYIEIPYKKSEMRDYNIPNATEYTKCVAYSTFSRNKYVLANIFSKNFNYIHIFEHHLNKL